MEEGSIGDFAQFLIDTNGIHEIISPTDYRTKSLRGTQAYYSVANGGKDEFDETLRQALGKKPLPSEPVNRKLLRTFKLNCMVLPFRRDHIGAGSGTRLHEKA